MEERFNIYYAGQVADDHDRASVRQRLGQMFKASDAVLDKLFSGDVQLLKKNCDAETAAKYKEAMARAGAVAILRVLEPPPSAVDHAPEPADAKPRSATGDADSLVPAKKMTTAERIAALTAQSDASPFAGSDEDKAAAFDDWASPEDDGDKLRVTPRGTDVLREQERSVAKVKPIDTSSLQLDEAAERLSAAPEPPPPPPDTGHLNMGEVGETIPNLPAHATAIDPDISALDLSPQGFDFSDCAAARAAPPSVDISAMQLAPEGSELVEAKYRKGAPPPPPSTDHITVEE